MFTTIPSSSNSYIHQDPFEYINLNVLLKLLLNPIELLKSVLTFFKNNGPSKNHIEKTIADINNTIFFITSPLIHYLIVPLLILIVFRIAAIII